MGFSCLLLMEKISNKKTQNPDREKISNKKYYIKKQIES